MTPLNRILLMKTNSKGCRQINACTLRLFYDVIVKSQEIFFSDFFLQLTFPDGNNTPALFSQCSEIISITLDIAINLFVPVFFVAGWPDKSATVMLMPETPINKYYCFVFGKYDIGTSGKFADVFAISKSLRKKILAYCFLWLRVGTPDMGHIFASYFL